MMLSEIIKVFDGGDGSGHYEHVGIPNHKGGSARSGKYRNYQNNKYSKKHIVYSKSDNRIDKIKNRIPKATKAEIKNYNNALEKYTEFEYNEIKQSYRNKYSGKEYDKYYEKVSNYLDDFIYRSEKFEGTIYRGLNLDKETALNIINKLKKGKTMDMQGISSWSSNRDVSKDFSENADDSSGNYCLLFNLKNKSGVSVKDLSTFSYEDEVLHPTTARYVLRNNEFKKQKLPNGKILIEINLKEV